MHAFNAALAGSRGESLTCVTKLEARKRLSLLSSHPGTGILRNVRTSFPKLVRWVYSSASLGGLAPSKPEADGYHTATGTVSAPTCPRQHAWAMSWRRQTGIIVLVHHRVIHLDVAVWELDYYSEM